MHYNCSLMILIVQLFECFIFTYYMDVCLYAEVEMSHKSSKSLEQIHLLGTCINLAGKAPQI